MGISNGSELWQKVLSVDEGKAFMPDWHFTTKDYADSSQ
jgi:hypothetical protein